MEELPPTSPTLNHLFLTRYEYNFSPTLAPLDPHLTASFLPEFSPAPVGQPAPAHHVRQHG